MMMVIVMMILPYDHDYSVILLSRSRFSNISSGSFGDGSST